MRTFAGIPSNALLMYYVDAGLRGFVVTGKEMGGPELAALLVRSLRGMVNRAAGRLGPLLFTISQGGVFTKLI